MQGSIQGSAIVW